MLESISKYIEVAKTEFKVGLTYIVSSYAGIFVGIMQIFIFYCIWKNVYIGKSTLGGISYEQMITYVVISRIIYAAFQWGINMFMADMILNGNISTFLLRPLDLQGMLFAGGIGGQVINTLLFNGIPVFIVSILFLNIKLPNDVLTYLLFFLSLLLGIVTAFLVDFIIGIFNFWTENGWGMQVIKEALLNFFSGALIPIVLFPSWLKTIADILPFKAMVSVPVNIFVKTFSINEAIKAIGLQFVWILILLFASRMIWNKAVKKVTVYGG